MVVAGIELRDVHTYAERLMSGFFAQGYEAGAAAVSICRNRENLRTGHRPLFSAFCSLLSGVSLFAVALSPAARAAAMPLHIARDGSRAPESAPITVSVQLPAENNWYLHPPQSSGWLQARALQYVVFWPTNAPADAQTLLFLIDRDGHWYQSLQERALTPGATNTFTVSLIPGAPNWQPVGHASAWHLRTRLDPKTAGVRIFGKTGFRGTCVLQSAALLQDDTPVAPPTIARVRPASMEVPCFGLFEVAFDLPDRYADPFDPAQIDVSAVFTTPEGAQVPVNGFYYQGFYRLHDEVLSAPQPQGRPEWRVRFCPRTPGAYRYTLRAKDPHGEAAWREGAFTATPADGPRFVRVSHSDRRFFEFDNGAWFYPIGHNIRSPYDSRMDDKFPWKFRHPEGTQAYERFFREMEGAQENLVEIWSCAWSLGIEWSEAVPGYHGSGDYHLANAWELDRVLELARQRHLRVNLVLNNHGRVSSWLDSEWGDNPYNALRGGWLHQAIDFFDNGRAIDMQRRLYRYYIARWGWDATIFAWELFSEVNLTGQESSQRANFDPRVVNWHRVIGAYFHAEDPNRHLVITHVSADYTFENPELCQLPELDACAVDAYHYAQPSQIVSVLQNTARFNNAFNKPIVVTEFGGSPMAAGLEHLKRELHAALWSSTSIPLAGTPLFWWWQLIEERNLYREYNAIARFQHGVDPRNPAMKPAAPGLHIESGADGSPLGDRIQAVGMSSSTNAVGWIYVSAAFGQRVPSGNEEDGSGRAINRLQAVIDNFRDGSYRVDFVDTATGQTSKRAVVRASGGQLILAVPSFARDIAYRVTPAAP